VTTNRADPTSRFSNRVADYVRFRPSYPLALLALLREEAGVGPGTTVADVGAGTGIFSALVLETGSHVIGVEPNQQMREAAQEHIGPHPRYRSVAGAAEATGLAKASVDLITVAQAFHWFPVEETSREFRKILRPGGRVALIWNTRRVTESPFLEGYESILEEWGTDYTMVRRSYDVEDSLAHLFDGAEISHRSFPNEHLLGYEALEGRLLSSSYMPTREDPNGPAMLTALAALFGEHATDDTVKMEYDTEVYYGLLK
jgi:SAM-dependent methyltransferase